MSKALPARQRGVAMILVLWVAMLLTVIAGSFALATRTDMAVVQNSVERARAEAAADAALHYAMMEMYKSASDLTRWKSDGEPHDFEWQGNIVRVSLMDESGKIDINAASPELLKGLLVLGGATDDQAVKLVDAIQDWRDTDTLRRLNGAEEAEYQAAGLKYKPSNTPFQTIEELRMVLGMTPELYRRIAPDITIFSRQAGLNYAIAPRSAMLALPGVTREQVDAYIAQRTVARASGLPVPPFEAALRFGATQALSAVYVRAEVTPKDGAGFVRGAVVRLTSDPKRPYTFLSWREDGGNVDPPDTVESNQRGL